MPDFTPSNPVWDGYCADPFVLRSGDFYYCYGTGSSREAHDLGGRQFVVLRSRDLRDWEFVGGALEPAQGLERAAHWAPEVAFAKGKFWMYYSAARGDDTTHRLRVALADEPQGPFRDEGEVLPAAEGFSIDASPFCDPQSGKWYLYFAKDFFENRIGTGAAVVPLADDMKTPLAPSTAVLCASHDWQIFARHRVLYGQIFPEWHTVEGPFVVFRNGQYFCFFSGGCWENETYGVGCAVANSPLGPFREIGEGPTVLGGTAQVIGPGHNSVVLGPDGETLLCVYHAWNDERTKRQLYIDPIEWMPNGPKVTPTRNGAVSPLKAEPLGNGGELP